MAVTSSTLRKLATLNLNADQMAGVLELLAEQQEAEEARLLAQRERKARQRLGQSRDSHGTGVGQNTPDKEKSPTPPKEINPKNSPPSGVRTTHAKGTPRSELSEVLDSDHAQAVIDHRQRIRKPLTPHAAKLLASKFAQCPDPNAAADAMIANGWQGFEPEWMGNRQSRGSPSSKAQTVTELLKQRREARNADTDNPPRTTYLAIAR